MPFKKVTHYRQISKNIVTVLTSGYVQLDVQPVTRMHSVGLQTLCMSEIKIYRAFVKHVLTGAHIVPDYNNDSIQYSNDSENGATLLRKLCIKVTFLLFIGVSQSTPIIISPLIYLYLEQVKFYIRTLWY